MTPCPRCGAALAGEPPVCPRCLLAAELPPARLGRLELLEEIGHGGMGTVFRARHPDLDREVAVKVLSPELAGRPGFLERFRREARLLARLSHRGIVAVHDAGCEEGESFIVMELAPGTPLSRHLPLPEAEAVDVVLQVCDALAYAHAQGIVHRDVKPENVLVDRTGAVKVTDFGIAALSVPEPGEPRLTEPGLVLGTPGYVAPEALQGKPPHPTMDVYAVGALLAQAVTGKEPGEGVAALPPSLAAIARRAMAADPARRHESITALATELRAARAGGDAHLPPDERLWLQAVALLLTTATAAALYAFVVSVTPRVLASSDVAALTMVGLEKLPDGRVISRARFETGPVLVALLAFAVAAGAFGALRAHWRHAGLDAPRPDVPLQGTRWVLALGSVAFTVFLVRRLFLAGLSNIYTPVIGGILETAALYLLWTALLEAARTSRPLSREPLLWVGTLLFLIPPSVELLAYVTSWTP